MAMPVKFSYKFQELDGRHPEILPNFKKRKDFASQSCEKKLKV
jgi:hypothetical protein